MATLQWPSEHAWHMAHGTAAPTLAGGGADEEEVQGSGDSDGVGDQKTTAWLDAIIYLESASAF